MDRDRKILIGNINTILDMLTTRGIVPDDFHSSLRSKLQGLGLLPQQSLGVQFYPYIRELMAPLSEGITEAQDFARNWRGSR